MTVTLRRTTGALLTTAATAFAGAATVLAATFDWPDILREPAAVVLPAFVHGGSAWSGPGSPPPGPTRCWPSRSCCCRPHWTGATTRCSGWPPRSGAASVLLSLIGFLRWVFVVPPLAQAYGSGDAAPGTRWPPPGWPSTSSVARCSVSTWDSCWPSAGRPR